MKTKNLTLELIILRIEKFNYNNLINIYIRNSNQNEGLYVIKKNVRDCNYTVFYGDRKI